MELAESNTVSLDDLKQMKAQINSMIQNTKSMIQNLRVFIPKVENTLENTELSGRLHQKDSKDINVFCKDLVTCLMSLNTKLAETTEKVNQLERITSESNTTHQLRPTRGRIQVDSGCYSVSSAFIRNEMADINEGATEHSMGTLSRDVEGSTPAASTETITTEIDSTPVISPQTLSDIVPQLDNLNTLNVNGLTVSSIETGIPIHMDSASLRETHAENGNSKPTEKHLEKECPSQSQTTSDTDGHSSVVLNTETVNTSGGTHVGNTEPFSKPEMTLNVTEEDKAESDNDRTEKQETDS